jgi:hypothetical protein
MRALAALRMVWASAAWSVEGTLIVTCRDGVNGLCKVTSWQCFVWQWPFGARRARARALAHVVLS